MLDAGGKWKIKWKCRGRLNFVFIGKSKNFKIKIIQFRIIHVQFCTYWYSKYVCRLNVGFCVIFYFSDWNLMSNFYIIFRLLACVCVNPCHHFTFHVNVQFVVKNMSMRNFLQRPFIFNKWFCGKPQCWGQFVFRSLLLAHSRMAMELQSMSHPNSRRIRNRKILCNRYYVGFVTQISDERKYLQIDWIN